jgi:1,4-dihydroxy-2-naphthoate octaprenyltransferase
VSCSPAPRATHAQTKVSVDARKANDRCTGTVNQYSRRVAIVQTGWRTQLSLGVLASCIIGTCIVLLSTAQNEETKGAK